MSPAGIVQFVLLLVAIAVTVPFLGRYMAKVYGEHSDHRGEPLPAPGDKVFRPIERLVYRACRIDPTAEQRWTAYGLSLLAFSAVSVIALYGLLRLQGHLPGNPTDVGAVSPAVAWNTAISFVTNTNWQAYSGEVTMSHLSQMVGLTVQNFVSAAAGMAVIVAIIRGLIRRRSTTLGNFWVDLTRTITRILLPLAFVMAIALMAGGVIQNFTGTDTVTTLERQEQTIPGGPVASQEAIKQLGSNGGGFFNANSAHPLENPNPLTNFIELWAIVAIPLAFPFAYGRMVGDRRQGRVLLAVMVGLWVLAMVLTGISENSGNSELASRGVDQGVTATQPGGNMEGKEIRFGPSTCALWVGSTTGTSNGSVNCMHDSLTASGGGVALFSMMLGEMTPGGVGVGLMGLLVYALLSVFIAGLMVGRTPEYLGKKIQAAEMKLVVIYLIAMPLAVLGLAAIAIRLPDGARTSRS